MPDRLSACPVCATAVDRDDRFCRGCGAGLAGMQPYAEDLARTILENVPAGIFTLDREGRVRSWNRAMEEQTGIRRRDALGGSLFSALAVLEPHRQHILRVIETALPLRLETTPDLEKDESGRPEAYWFRPVVLANGAPALLGMREQVNPGVLVDDRMIRSERLAAVGELAAGVAHNFNNILASIGGDAQLLKLLAEDHKLPDVVETAQQIYEETMRGGRIAHDLLSFARGAEPHIERLEIRGVLEDAVRLIRNHPAARQVAVSLNLDAHLPLVEADRDLLHQVFFNLMLNAVQAMPQGGQISLGGSVRRHDRDPLLGVLDVKIHDTGVGIAREQLRRIFDPFFSQRAHGGKGCGLGLPVSLAMIKSIGGDIQVSSAEGVGTTVSVTLPIVERRSAPRGAPDQPPERRALVVDDDPNLLRTLGTLLQRRGFEVLSASDEAEAVARYTAVRKERAPDVVVTELIRGRRGSEGLPGRFSGLDPELPVVVLTGSTDRQELLQAVEAGAQFVFSKPPNYTELLAVVEKLARKG